MIPRKFIICLLIIILVISPASAAGVSLNKWVLNVTLHDDGLVDEVVQAEFENSGPAPLEGFSFVVPAAKVIINYDQFISIPSTGQLVEQKTVPGGTKITVSFNNSVEPGKKWNGRFGITAQNWLVKQGQDYSINIPIEAPLAIISKKETAMSLPAEPEIRSQVFLPKSVELTSVQPEPFRKLFQYGRIVPTWSPEKLHAGDVIRINGSYSDVLNKIVEVDERSRSLTARVKEAKAQGKDVSAAEGYIANANDYNNNQALADFWEKKYTDAQEYAGYASNELNKAENSLTASPERTQEPAEPPKSPGFIAPVLFLALAFALLMNRRK